MRDLRSFPDAHLRIFERPTVPTPDQIKSVYLIGICGTGMGSLAGLFQESGYSVSGSDEHAYPPMSTRLREMGIPVLQGFDAAHLDPAPDLVVIGNACTPVHLEATYARDNRLAQMSLPEAISHFFIRDRRSLVVAGTHGKTTTTGMLIHAFRSAEKDPGFLVGGIMQNTRNSYHDGSGNHFIVEGDEYDSAYFDKRPKFLHYRPTGAIVTSMEFDHADIYDDWDMYRSAFEAFAQTVPAGGLLVLCGDDPNVRELARHTAADVRYYGLDFLENDVTASNLQVVDGSLNFSLVSNGERVTELVLPMTGRHNLLNALAAATLALHEGLQPEDLTKAFQSFKGLKRRQEVRGVVNDVIVIDDFAHHPTAVHATVGAIRQRWPRRRLIAVFEPRSNSSRRKVFESAYAKAFNLANAVFFSTPPLRHNDNPEDFMDVTNLTHSIRNQGMHAENYATANELLEPLLDFVQPGDVVLIMSNGGFGNIHDRLLESLKTTES